MSQNEALITCENVSKKFCKDLKQSLWYGVKDITNEVLTIRKDGTKLRPGEFWSLRNVSFEVRRGEMLGLVGQNGAGKSTLLKLLCGLIKPDTGKITMKGQVQALIELGAGFNPILTGRENVYINAAVLGIPREKIDEAIPHIIEFSGLKDFMDMPVNKYSSGMKSRLGFSIIAQLDPDIILIDEVLAVGDMAFQEKCMRRMDSLRKSDKAIIFVTHSLYQVEALCNKALWIDKGNVIQYGEASEVVRAYLDDQERRSMEESRKEGVKYQGRTTEMTKAYLKSRDEQRESEGLETLNKNKDLIAIENVEIVNAEGKPDTEFPFRSDLTVRIHYYTQARIETPLFNMRIFSKRWGGFTEAGMLIDGSGPDSVEGSGIVECCFASPPITPGDYSITLFIRSKDGIANLFNMRTVAWFRITDENIEKISLKGPMALNHIRQGSPIYLNRTWKFYRDGQLTDMIEATLQ
ncbi:MAG: ABC transporter ATP-binding protein [Desulfobacteraceae bacterium]|nr:MAG: ABC transporter ATP-binding protein [Desulfobacteraceae bacterium]